MSTKWKWLLPIAQVVLALACKIYEPHQYRVLAERNGVEDNLYWELQHSPAPAGRVSLAINFPAWVLAVPLKDTNYTIYQHNSNYTYVRITPRDLGFFAGVALFWYWVGSRLSGPARRGSPTKWSRTTRRAGLACGVVFGILTGVLAYKMLSLEWVPWRQIGTCGLAWALALTTYFCWKLKQEIGPQTTEPTASR